MWKSMGISNINNVVRFAMLYLTLMSLFTIIYCDQHGNFNGAFVFQNTIINKRFSELESKLSLQDHVISNLVHTSRIQEDTIRVLQTTVGEQTGELERARALMDEIRTTCSQTGQKLVNGAKDAAKDATPYLKSSYGCVAANVSLSCPDNQVISVASAEYGEWSQGCSSSCCPPHPYDCTEAMVDSNPNEWLMLKASCDNRSSCVYRFQGSTFVTKCTVDAPVAYVNIFFNCEPEDTDAVVGFTAYPLSTRNYTQNQTVLFDGIVTNYGDHFDASSGIFLCPFSGVYFFSMHLFTAQYHLMVAAIVRESSTLVQVYAHDASGDHGAASTTVVTECEVGERVWVATISSYTGQLYGGRYSSFSGYLLQRN